MKGGFKIKVKDRKGKIREITLKQPCVHLMAAEFGHKTAGEFSLVDTIRVNSKVFKNIPCLCEMLNWEKETNNV